jgi:hypothetical protein
LETIKPFLVFYGALPPYARQTQRLAPPTLRLRAAIAAAKDMERTFFEDLPSALGYAHVADELTSDEELVAYIDQLRASIRELQGCYDSLVDRIEAHLLTILGADGELFPHYKQVITARFADLRMYLLLPRQRTFYVRLVSPLEDRASWLGAVVQSVLGREIKQMSDDDELVVYGRLNDAVRELDNLCDFANLSEEESYTLNAVRVEITTPRGESRKFVERLPKHKEAAAAEIEAKLRDALGDDSAANTMALVRLLQEFTLRESNEPNA